MILESRLGSIVPDIIIISSGKSLIIEIKVTHGVSSEKAHKIRQLNIPAIEVIAGHLLKKLYSEKKYHLNDNEYKRFLIEESGYKYWIHNPKGELKIKKIKNELKNYCDEKEIKYLKFKNSNFDFYYGGGNDEMYYVGECPIGKNIWKGGRNKGKSYAKYYEDCSYCKFNPDAGQGSQLQQKVNCGGGIIRFNNLIKSLS